MIILTGKGRGINKSSFQCLLNIVNQKIVSDQGNSEKPTGVESSMKCPTTTTTTETEDDVTLGDLMCLILVIN